MSSIAIESIQMQTNIVRDNTRISHWVKLRKLQGLDHRPKEYKKTEHFNPTEEQREESSLYHFCTNILRKTGSWNCRVEPPSDTTGFQYLIHLTKYEQIIKICYDEKNWTPFNINEEKIEENKNKKKKKKKKKTSLRTKKYYVGKIETDYKSFMDLIHNNSNDITNMKKKCAKLQNDFKKIIDRIKQDEEKRKEEAILKAEAEAKAKRDAAAKEMAEKEFRLNNEFQNLSLEDKHKAIELLKK